VGRIRVANDIEAIGELPFELNNGFILHLHNVLYIPSLNRNLISVSCLDDDGFDCQFGNKQCSIIFDSKVVGRIRVTNGIEAKVDTIRELPLELNNGFIFCLHNILYVPSLSRNLISVSCLDDDGFDCQFGNKQCSIIFDSKVVGLAFCQDKLYMLSLHENLNVVCNNDNIVCDDESVVCNEKASSSTNVSSKCKRCDDATLVKLWHYYLGHISRERIERLIKDDNHHLLDFSNLDYCIDCIKVKYVKQVKKGEAKRSAGILKIIHTDICGPFPIKYVDGFDSFITFTNAFSCYDYIYPIKKMIGSVG
jgi:hypothetical protein